MKRMQKELLRKGVHILTGVAIVLLVRAQILSVSLLGLFVFLFAAVVFFNFKYEKELLNKILSVNRADKMVPGLDILGFFFGSWLVLLIFPDIIAYAAIMILSFGDSFAHLVGAGFGGADATVTRSSYIWGAIAGTIAGTIAASLYVPLIPALIASAIAMIVEAGELRIADHHVDDNLTIPIVSGVVLWVIQYAIPY